MVPSGRKSCSHAILLSVSIINRLSWFSDRPNIRSSFARALGPREPPFTLPFPPRLRERREGKAVRGSGSTF